MIKFNLIEKFKVVFHLKKRDIGIGGKAGEVFIAARKIIGRGKISADGGDGSIGGEGGKVTVISEDNKFTGEISAKGGKSLLKIRKWYEKWWGILILGVVASSLVATIFTSYENLVNKPQW